MNRKEMIDFILYYSDDYTKKDLDGYLDAELRIICERVERTTELGKSPNDDSENL